MFMKKYLGSQMTVYAAFVLPVFILGPIVFAVIILDTGVSAYSVMISLMCLFATVISVIYLKQVSNQLYSWGTFTDKEVRVKSLFSKEYTIMYSKCCGVGIASYVHGVLNSGIGTEIYFIYLSYDCLPARFKNNINLWKPSKDRIKVKFDPKLYDYLLTVLSKKQVYSLQRDYDMMLEKEKEKKKQGR